MSRSSTLLMTVLLGLLAASEALYGQGVGGIPTPGGSPLSPWLNLYQRQAGPVDNYHMYVQPALQLRDTLQNQQMGIRNNAVAVSTVASQFASQAEAYYAPASPTGISAGFMNYGAYFNTTTNGAQGAGVFGMPGTGGLGRPGLGGVGAPGGSTWSLPPASSHGTAGSR